MRKRENGKSKKNVGENFYERLPRFVAGSSVAPIGENPSPIVRFVELGGWQFALTVVPARVISNGGDNGFEEHFRFPGDFEQSLETVLRGIAGPANINFNEEKYILACSLRQLIDGINTLADDNTAVNQSRIEIALAALMNVNYILKSGEREFYFRPIEALRRVEKDDETYYKISFTPFFFNDNWMFERLFAD